MRAARNLEGDPHSQSVMAGRPPVRKAPLFGQRLAAARKNRGWSQTRLAQALETTQKVIDYYERRAANPSLAFIQRSAKALEVSAAELVGSESNKSRSRLGPLPALALRFEQIRRLPRKKQEFVIRFLDLVLEKSGRS